MVRQRRVAVIGAGASGLPCIRYNILIYRNIKYNCRHARLYGLDVVCFEASEYVGGLWRYRSSEEESQNLASRPLKWPVSASSVMKSTVINTSKEMTAYSDFPPAPDTPNFMHNTQMYRSVFSFHYFQRNSGRDKGKGETGIWLFISNILHPGKPIMTSGRVKGRCY